MTKKLTSTEIKKLIKSKNLVIGNKRTLKNLKLGKVDKVIISSNCPQKDVDNLDYFSGLAKVETIKVPYPNEDLGVICKKPFYISVLSILKGAK